MKIAPPIRLITYDPGRDITKMKVRIPQSRFKKLFKGVIAEFLGTMFLVFYAAGSVMTAFYVTGGDSAARILLISTIQGFALAALIWSISGISGCNLNPAVSVANMLSGRVGLINAIAYIAAQVVGSIAGAAIIKGCIPWRFTQALGNTRLGPGVGSGNGFLFEMITTSFLCMIVLGTSIFNIWDRKLNRIAPFAIGMALFAGVAVALPFTGGALNPVRALGPSIVGGTWYNHWIYWLGPMVGALMAAFIFRVLLQERFDVIDKPGYIEPDLSMLKGKSEY
ncbi:aquaporin [Heterostelium album PN500]|uniref:Aquaporin n=1 Tax=Heterostelium pallidum (strain ATCC 26659 / Pp 5 / PN500) TaxID=670386 RepID=D3BRS7_HETP5|nr:aquaporin [Heterostelium album PN500]EFA76109.1 aquaporin [Heterostelium album PN500]|eukprot:XP_020428243.1 aquaporin [Heterostelium album PN500]